MITKHPAAKPRTPSLHSPRSAPANYKPQALNKVNVPQTERRTPNRNPVRPPDRQARPTSAAPNRTRRRPQEHRPTRPSIRGEGQARQGAAPTPQPYQIRRSRQSSFQSFRPGANAADKHLRIIPLGGLGEIGRNMTILEYQNDIVLLDMGFQYPEDNTPGIDYIIPNITYLMAKRHKIRGIIISQGHFDHIGAIPYLIDRLGNPPIYSSALAKAIILKRQEEFHTRRKLDIEVVSDKDIIKLGAFKIEIFHVSHNIPDALGFIIETPAGRIVNPIEFKIDYDKKGKPTNVERFQEIAKKGTDLLMLDSTNAETREISISEEVVEKNLEEIFRSTKGRVFIATFASLLDRVGQVIKIAQKTNRKVFIDGRSLKSNLAIAQQLGYIKTKPNTLLSIDKINDYDDDKILAFCTGAQGEDRAVLMRVANGEHRHIKLKKGDSVVLSSSVVPGNERSVQALKDNLSRQGATIYHYKMMDIHSSGHATQPELRFMIELMKPKFFMPVHGYYYMRKVNTDLAKSTGIPDKNIAMIDNGDILLFNNKEIKVSKDKAPAYPVMVDGLGVGDVKEVVLRDREMLAKDGMFVVIATVNGKTGKVKGNPDIISRGFVYLRESKELLMDVRYKVKGIVERAASAGNYDVDWDYVKREIRDKIGLFLFQRTERRPMVLPVIIEI